MADEAERPISKKKKFVRDGVFYAELNELFSRELAADGYAGVEVRLTPARTEIVIMATRTQNVLGERGRRIRELTALVQKRFNFQPDTVELYVEQVKNKALSALAQAEAVKFRLSEGLSVRRASNSVLRFIMDNPGARGCEIIVSGKLRGQRAKGMKFKEGYMICSGDAKNYYIDEAVKHLCLRQGVLGIKVKIMLAHDPMGVDGPAKDLPDIVNVLEPKPHEIFKPEEPEPQYQSQQYDDQGYGAGGYPQDQYGQPVDQQQPGPDQPGPEMSYQPGPEQPATFGQDQPYEEPQAQGGYQRQEFQQDYPQEQPFDTQQQQPAPTGDTYEQYPQSGYEQQPQEQQPPQDYPQDYQQQPPQQEFGGQYEDTGYQQPAYDDGQQQQQQPY